MSAPAQVDREALERLLEASRGAVEVLKLLGQFANEDRILKGVPPQLRQEVEALLVGTSIELYGAVCAMAPDFPSVPRHRRLPGTGPEEARP